jgi:hypothetical protein
VLELIEGLPDDVIGFEAVGQVTAEDYESVVFPALEDALRRHPKISMMHVLGERFTGYSEGGELSDAKLGLMHPLSWRRIAVVSDLASIRRLVKSLGWSIPGELKLFSNAQRTEAEAWVQAGRQD